MLHASSPERGPRRVATRMPLPYLVSIGVGGTDGVKMSPSMLHSLTLCNMPSRRLPPTALRAHRLRLDPRRLFPRPPLRPPSSRARRLNAPAPRACLVTASLRVAQHFLHHPPRSAGVYAPWARRTPDRVHGQRDRSSYATPPRVVFALSSPLHTWPRSCQAPPQARP